jgi:hypothetical protein
MIYSNLELGSDAIGKGEVDSSILSGSTSHQIAKTSGNAVEFSG